MLRPLARILAVVLILLLASGCGLLRFGKARKRAGSATAFAESRRAPLAVGHVSLVNEEERFALIEANLVQSPAPGTALRSYSGNEVTGELRATGVRRRPFLVADLVSGMPQKGDLVVQDAGSAAPTPTPVAAPAAESATAVPEQRWKRWLGFFRGRK